MVDCCVSVSNSVIRPRNNIRIYFYAAKRQHRVLHTSVIRAHKVCISILQFLPGSWRVETSIADCGGGVGVLLKLC